MEMSRYRFVSVEIGEITEAADACKVERAVEADEAATHHRAAHRNERARQDLQPSHSEAIRRARQDLQVSAIPARGAARAISCGSCQLWKQRRWLTRRRAEPSSARQTCRAPLWPPSV